MNKGTLDKFREGVYSVYEQLYTSNIGIRLLDETDLEPNIYNESEKKYKEPIFLLAKITLNNKTDELSAVGQQNMAEGTVEVPYLELKKHGLDDVPLSILRKGIIKFRNDYYDIVNIPIETTFNNEINKYIFEIKVRLDG